MARIFLCHASEDKDPVREVYHRLRACNGFEPWLDEEDLLPGQDWDYEIKRALKASDFILIFFSRSSVAKRGYVQREMKLALDALQEVPESTIHTIPVRLDACDVPQSFRRYHWVNLYEPNGFHRIVTAIRCGLQERGQSVPQSTETITSVPTQRAREGGDQERQSAAEHGPSDSRQQNVYDEEDILALIPYSVTNALNDHELERTLDTFSLVQGNLSIHKYTRQELDNIAPSQREKLFTAAPEMEAWWRGKSTENGAWPLFRLKGGIWLSKDLIGQIPSEHGDTAWKIPGLLEWYMEGEVF